jgi:hypothetical protein
MYISQTILKIMKIEKKEINNLIQYISSVFIKNTGNYQLTDELDLI